MKMPTELNFFDPPTSPEGRRNTASFTVIELLTELRFYIALDTK